MTFYSLKEKLLKYVFQGSARFFLIAIIIWMGLMGILNSIYGTQWGDILVEANGMTFDLFIVGLLFSVYENWREERETIKRLQDEIDGLRGRNEKEATYRIMSIVKKLIKFDCSDIDLNRCYLNGVAFGNIDLSMANLMDSDLSKSRFWKANLNLANLSGADLRNASLREVNLIDANLDESELSWADLQKSNLQNANLHRAILTDAILDDANLKGANLYKATLDNALLHRVILQDADLQKASMKGADLQNSNLTNVDLEDADLQNSKIKDVCFINANLKGVNLQGAIVEPIDWFRYLEEQKISGLNQIMERYSIDETGMVTLK